MNILKLYRTSKEFTLKENQLINDAIEERSIETEDILVDFKEWVYSQLLPIDDEDLWAYDEHYQNGLTHSQNLDIFTNNLNP